MQVLQCAQIPKPARRRRPNAHRLAPTPEQQQEIDDYPVLARDFLRDATR